jgi:hypothetical protein
MVTCVDVDVHVALVAQGFNVQHQDTLQDDHVSGINLGYANQQHHHHQQTAAANSSSGANSSSSKQQQWSKQQQRSKQQRWPSCDR